MSADIIKVEGLGKKYIISHEGKSYKSFRDSINRGIKSIISNTEKETPAREEFWALKDINFEIKKGETIGIIGRNGAGKSTLLKLLSRITEPSHGRIQINGRVASLLEVGTGFHPELTGRENIFLNGAVLGMSRSEIRRKFNEIVEFSGVQKFLDTPVKHYSSGMSVRLAFAVAAHLEPEILIVDEVLAVGDMEFQKKCLGKMQDVSSHGGRTVLFVSHDLGSISQLCDKTMLLVDGRLSDFGLTETVIKKYMHLQPQHSVYNAAGTNKQRFIKEMKLIDEKHQESSSYAHDETITIEFVIVIDSWSPGLYLAFAIQNRLNKRIGLDYVEIKEEHSTENSAIRVRVKLPAGFLAPGSFSIDASLLTPNVEAYDLVFGVCPFEVIDNNSSLRPFSKTDYGDVFLKTTHSFH